MNPSKVYFTDFRSVNWESNPNKLQRLLLKGGIKDIDMDGKYVAIKMHFGEVGNLAYLRPAYAKAVADVVKSLGGRPFLTDCNTLYPGYRKDALGHLDAAQLNGFNETTTGCHVIIADGLRGTDEVDVPVPHGELCQEAHIGRAVMDADIFISLTHFKGHEEASFGGALKNIGMGCGSRAGKMAQHSSGKPKVDESKCRGCRSCSRVCGSDAISYPNKKAVIDLVKCKGCGRCIGACAFDAISPLDYSANTQLDKKIAEYAYAVCANRPCFHVALIMDVSPTCDCAPCNDSPIIPNIGMLCSKDPVALDQACVDLCNAKEKEYFVNSQLGDNVKKGTKLSGDIFHDNNGETDSKTALEHAEKIGFGTRQYELVIMK